MEGKRNGHGKYMLPNNKNSINGYWRNDKPEGRMEITYINGDQYNGQIRDFKKNDSRGTLILSDGTEIFTSFENDILNDDATIIYPNY